MHSELSCTQAIRSCNFTKTDSLLPFPDVRVRRRSQRLGNTQISLATADPRGWLEAVHAHLYTQQNQRVWNRNSEALMGVGTCTAALGVYQPASFFRSLRHK